ncbi:MAG TPA: hypothetical protein VLT33_20610, partial [Labilithrix sp.]|nr:hypothetical protein [Labilithrix sp.]
LFLREFVGNVANWVHCDIAGPAMGDRIRGWDPKGGTGHGVLTFLDLIERAARNTVAAPAAAAAPVAAAPPATAAKPAAAKPAAAKPAAAKPAAAKPAAAKPAPAKARVSAPVETKGRKAVASRKARR